jgi:oxygen-dependent protoporphyrinogen oxidase
VVGQRRVVVIGAGVSGLATAYHLSRGQLSRGSETGAPGQDRPERLVPAPPCSVTVLEAGAVPGGRIATMTVAGISVDTGPDALLIRSPAAAALVADLGLEPLLRAPAAGGAYVWSRGRLRPLPAGSVFGVPQRLTPLLRSGLLGPAGFLRAGADLVLPRGRLGADPTIEALLRPRFGRQVYERIVEPMLGGVHAGQAGRLSARSAVPEVAALAERHRSLYLALRGGGPARSSAGPAGERGNGTVAASAPSRPPLMTLDGGLTVLVQALREEVGRAGGRVVTGACVSTVSAGPPGAGYRLTGTGFDPIEADDVVLATPAGEAARLLRPMAPAASAALEAIPYAGVATVILGYRPEDVVTPPGTGFLVPPVEGRLLVGCTWTTAKWPHLTAARSAGTSRSPGSMDGAPPVLIRAMTGRDGDQAWAALDDAALVAAVRAELAASMALRAEPTAVLVRRMPAAMPQYTVGHAGRLAAAQEALAAVPGVHLTGAGYRGAGIAACLAQAREAAAAVLGRAVPARVAP